MSNEIENAAEGTPDEPVFAGRLLTTAEAAEATGLSPKVLANYRCVYTHLSPPFHRYGRSVRYSLSELLEWIDGRAAR